MATIAIRIQGPVQMAAKSTSNLHYALVKSGYLFCFLFVTRYSFNKKVFLWSISHFVWQEKEKCDICGHIVLLRTYDASNLCTVKFRYSKNMFSINIKAFHVSLFLKKIVFLFSLTGRDTIMDRVKKYVVFFFYLSYLSSNWLD